MTATCHPTKMAYVKNLCRNCYEKELRASNPDYAERQREGRRAWGKRNPERLQEYNQRKVRNDTPEKKRERHLKADFGITLAQYGALLKSQNGVCAICKRPPKNRALAVDHCHKTNEIRGLLCFRCNYGMSWFQHNPAFLGLAGAYLIDPPAKAILGGQDD